MKTHRFDPNLSIKCGVNSCTEKYTNYESFRSHVYRKHKELVYHTDATDTSESRGTEDSTEISVADDHSLGDDQFSDDDDDDDNCRDQITNGSCTDAELRHSAAMFLLRMHEEHKVTQSALNGIVYGVQELWNDAIETLKVYTFYACVCISIYNVHYILSG